MSNYTITLNDFDRRVLINGLVGIRNDLLQTDRSTNYIDDLLLKIIDAPQDKKLWGKTHEDR